MNYTQDKDSNREAFQIGEPETQEQTITVDKPHVAMSIWNLLITGVCIGLFCYVNSYFLIQLHNVVNNSNLRTQTATFSCDYYYCDQTLYNFMYYYTYYAECNPIICASAICSNYASSCNNSAYYPDLNRFFACQPTCPNYQPSVYPPVLLVGYALSIAAATTFALFILLPIVASFWFNICAKQITPKQRIALLIAFMWPAWKYHVLRQRKSWDDFDLNLKALVVIDYFRAILLSITMAIYIWFYSVGTWFENKQISLFFILLGCYITHWLLCWSNGRTFWKAKERFT